MELLIICKTLPLFSATFRKKISNLAGSVPEYPLVKKAVKKVLGNKEAMSVAKGSGLTFALKILGMIFTYMLIWVMARYMGAGTVGEFNLMMAICSIIAIVSRLGFQNSLIRFIAQARTKGKNVYSNILFLKTTWIILVVNIFLGIGLYFAAPLIADGIFGKGFLTPVIQWSLLSIFPMSFSYMAAAYMRGHKKVWEFSMLQDFGNYLFCLLLFVPLVFVWPDRLLPVMCWDVSWFLVMLAALVLIARLPHTRIFKFRGARLIETLPLLKVSVPMMMTNSLVFLLNWMDTFMIGMYKTTADVGIYASASRIAMLTTLMLTANSAIAGPKIVSLYTEGKTRQLKNLLTYSTLMVSAFAIPVALLMILFPGFILGLFGKEFEAGSWVLIILAVAQVINTSTGLVGLTLNMTGKEVLMQNLMIITTLVNLVLNVLLIPPYGIEGAAIATGFSLSMKNLVSFYYVKKHLGFYSLSFDFILDKLKNRKSPGS